MESRTPPKPLWVMSGGADTVKNGQWHLECDDIEFEGWADRRTRSGRRLRKGEWPATPPVYVFDRVEGEPDINWTAGEAMCVVSDRLRAHIESLDPGAAEFLPVSIKGTDGRRMRGPFWAVNWLSVWDCQPDPEMPELAPSAIPNGRHFGVVPSRGHWYGGSLVVSDQARLALQKVKYRGLRFEKARIASGPDDPCGLPKYGKHTPPVLKKHVPWDPRFDVDAFFERFPGGKGWVQTGPGSTPLLEYVVMRGMGVGSAELPVVRRMLEEGEDPNVPDRVNGSSAVMKILPMTEAMLRLLHAHGANWRSASNQGRTPLHNYVGCAPVAGLQLLLEWGADPNAVDFAGATPAHELARFEGLIRPKSSWAARWGLLAQFGANLNAHDCHGLTPLHVYLTHRERAQRDLAMVRAMLQAGADANRVTGRSGMKGEVAGRTALMIAPFDAPMTRFLLKAGVDPAAKCANGSTALDMMRKESKSKDTNRAESAREALKVIEKAVSGEPQGRRAPRSRASR